MMAVPPGPFGGGSPVDDTATSITCDVKTLKEDTYVTYQKYIIMGKPTQIFLEAETACQKWGGSAFMKLGVIYIHSEYIRHRLLHSS